MKQKYVTRTATKHTTTSANPNKFIISTTREEGGRFMSAGKPQSPKFQASQFSNIGPSRSTVAIMARNNALNGLPPSPKSRLMVARNLNNFIKEMSLNNIKTRSAQNSQRTVKLYKQDSIVERNDKNHNISIQDGLSPGLSSGMSPMIMMNSQQNTYKSIPNVNNYLSSKKTIYQQNKEQINDKLQVYETALWNMIKRNDENELMDFDKRYYRCVRQKRLQQIIRQLLKKSKELQISLQDLIDNRMTQTKPYQQQGSYTFIYYVKKGMLDQLESILQSNPLFVHDFDEKGMTPLHIATHKQNLDVIKILLAYNANILCKDLSGLTPLQYAIKLNNYQIVNLFLTIQCPSDLQYASYLKLTKNSSIHELLQKAKLKDLLSRSYRFPDVNQFIQKLLDQLQQY